MYRKLLLVLAGWVLTTTAEAQLRFGGFFVLGGEEFVALSVPSTGMTWAKVGTTYRDYQILKLDRSEKKLYLKLGNEELVVPMSEQKIVKAESQPPLVRFATEASNAATSTNSAKVFSRFPETGLDDRSVEGLNWDWINSDKNPMKKLPVQPSIREQDDWPNLSNDAKADLVELYRQHGWHILVELNEAGVGVRYRKAKPKTEP